MVLGTPRYMSPEQISGLPVDQRSDIFSLGTVLYEMLTQTSLFAGQDVDQIAYKVTTNEPAPPSHKNPELPQILDFIVARALKKEPSVRYQDAYEMAADLRDALAEMRGRAPAREPESDTTMTQKIGAGADKLPVAPPASAIAKDTRLPMSRVFDSEAALARIGAPGEKDRLTRAPRPVGLARRVLRDRLPRRLAVAALLAAALGGWIALG
jgi:serine/threonine-protein kinase